MRKKLLWIIGLLVVSACKPGGETEETEGTRVDFRVAATIMRPGLDEISGMAVLAEPTLLVHNDDGDAELFVIDGGGSLTAILALEGATNRDWEELTWVSRADGRWLAVGDIGDNQARRERIRIYFVDVPPALTTADDANPPQSLPLRHTLELTYPDGPRDCEAMAYDAASDTILLLTKRDKPPRLYGADARAALSEPTLELEFLGEATRFRPPTRRDYWLFGTDSAYVSQPTGMDIDAAGTLAAVITYRSLYLFRREPGQSWADAFRQPPREFLGPRSRGEEAIAFGDGMDQLYITTEGYPAPIYRVALPAPRE